MKKKYSVAFGGGASRGFIHIGVLKYLEESKVRVVELSGTSMGAIIAAFCATGLNYKDIKDIAKSVDFKKLIDIDLSHGLIKGNKVYKKLKEFFGDKKIEDLEIPLKIVATNIETGKVEVFTKGKIIDALRASISLPGIFVPYKIKKSYYVDGGVVNNLPVDILEGKKIIGVSALKDIKGPLDFKKKFLGFEIKTGFFDYNYQVLHRAILLMMKQNEAKSIKKLKNDEGIIIRPEFGKLDYQHYYKVDEFVKIGYLEAKKKLEKLLN